MSCPGTAASTDKYASIAIFEVVEMHSRNTSAKRETMPETTAQHSLQRSIAGRIQTAVISPGAPSYPAAEEAPKRYKANISTNLIEDIKRPDNRLLVSTQRAPSWPTPRCAISPMAPYPLAIHHADPRLSMAGQAHVAPFPTYAWTTISVLTKTGLS